MEPLWQASVLRITIVQKEPLLQQFQNALQELTHLTTDLFQLLIAYLAHQVAIALLVQVRKIVLWVITVLKELSIKINIPAQPVTIMTKQVLFL